MIHNELLGRLFIFADFVQCQQPFLARAQKPVEHVLDAYAELLVDGALTLRSTPLLIRTTACL